MPKRERKTFGRRKKGEKYSSPGSSISPSLPPGCSWAEAVAVLIPARGDTLLFFLLLPAAKACLQNLHWSLVFVNQRWLTAPNLCIPNCPLHPSPISLSLLLNWWDASNALQSGEEFLTFPCGTYSWIRSFSFLFLQVIEKTVTKTSVYPTLITSQTTREISLRSVFNSQTRTNFNSSF